MKAGAVVFWWVGYLAVGGARPVADAGPPWGQLPLVDQVICSEAPGARQFAEDPPGASKVESILGRKCRVLPNEGGASFFAYVVGKGRGLKAGNAYVLEVTFPEDKPRAMFVLNRGCETSRGFATGAALGDVLYTYTNNNVESLRLPLSGEFRRWRMFFYLHDRFPGLKAPRGAGARPMLPQDGFWVVVARSSRKNAPRSAGPAVWRIRLFEVPEPRRFDLSLRLPPKGLPRRYIFSREEMADGVVAGRKPQDRGVEDETRWFEFKALVAKFLGMNCFCKDLLEFGHNQGWDSTPGGGNKWVWQSKTPKRWERILEMLRGYDLAVLPYYEYAGSIGQFGLGVRKKCLPLRGHLPYTHITWSEKANADVTDPETLEDVEKILDATILRHKDRVRFLGAWFRTRPSSLPISFSDSCLLRFAIEANNRMVATCEDLRRDAKLRQKYYRWWLGRRKQFLVALRDHLRRGGLSDAIILFTAYAAEPGPSLHGFQKVVVTDDVDGWEGPLAGPDHSKVEPYSYHDVVRGNEYLAACLRFRPTWGEWEWQHSVPPPDPQNYKDTEGVLMTFPFNRAYTVARPEPMEGFRGPCGLAIVRHYPLNENATEGKLGYFVCDVERAGPYCMLAEARAVANADPRFIGYLSAHTFNRGFPEFVRAFNAAFLALPALPSKVLSGACDAQEVVVREIDGGPFGVWLAVVNTGLRRVDATVRVPVAGQVTDAPTGRALKTRKGRLTVHLAPCQLRAVHIAPQR